MAAITKMYSLREIGEITGQHRTTLFRHIKSGKLKAVMIGNAWKVSEANLRAYLGETDEEQPE